MLSGKQKQSSIKINFSKEDLVDDNLLFVQKWFALSKEYQQRVSEYPVLTEDLLALQQEINLLSALKIEDQIAVEEFIDEINYLVDRKYKILKWIFFKNTWKLGIVIHAYNEQRVCYSIIRIKHGSTEPLIKYSGEKNFNKYKAHPCFGSNNFFIEGLQKIEANKFIGDQFEKILSGKNFFIGVKHICFEIIQSCLEKFEFCLGLERKDTYSISDIREAFEIYLPYWCTTAIEYIDYPKHLNLIDPESIRIHLRPKFYNEINEKVADRIKKKMPINDLSIGSYYYNFDFLFESLIFLYNSEISTIKRVYKRTYNKVEFDGETFEVIDYKNKENSLFNIGHVFSVFEKTYDEFIKLNELPIEEFRITMPESKLILLYTINSESVRVQEFYINNEQISDCTNKNIFVYNADDVEFSKDEFNNNFSINGKKYSSYQYGEYYGLFLFGKTPLYNLIILYITQRLERSFENVNTYMGWLEDL